MILSLIAAVVAMVVSLSGNVSPSLIVSPVLTLKYLASQADVVKYVESSGVWAACSLFVIFAAAAKSVAVAALPVEDADVPDILPVTLPVRLPVIVPVTFKVLSNVAAPVTSKVPGISTLFVHSTPLPPESVCSSCLAAPSANLLTAISAAEFILALTIVSV